MKLDSRIDSALGFVGIAIIAFGAWWYYDRPAQATVEDRAAIDRRFQEGAYIAQTKKVSPTEEVSILVLPSSLAPELDTKCVVYKNREFQQVTLTCPDANRDNIDLPEPP